MIMKFPPPAVIIAFMATGLALHIFFPVNIVPSPIVQYVGVFVIIARIVIEFYAKKSFQREDSKMRPWKTKTQYISSGIYRYSRNPVYLAFCLAPVGVGLILNSFWVLIMVIPSIVFMYCIVLKEEVQLEGVFGYEYARYRQQVRRWL